jgi:hypothetical protein
MSLKFVGNRIESKPVDHIQNKKKQKPYLCPNPTANIHRLLLLS